MSEKVILPQSEGATLQDQDDVVIWQKFNILLQAAAEVVAEFGSPLEHEGVARVTTGLRIVVQEAVRREMFSRSVMLRDPNENQLRTWYEVLKQLVEGDNAGTWERVGDSEAEYRSVVLEMKQRGIEMPAQSITLESLDMQGDLTHAD
jgi:hypothetical protein